jgi:hypothetical protein
MCRVIEQSQARRLSVTSKIGRRLVGARWLNAFKAGWRHGRHDDDNLRTYSVWTRASAYRLGLRLGRLAGDRTLHHQ